MKNYRIMIFLIMANHLILGDLQSNNDLSGARSASNLQSMHIFQSSNTYQNQPITADTILTISPLIPQKLQAKFARFIAANQDLAALLSGEEYYKTFLPGDEYYQNQSALRIAPYVLGSVKTPELLNQFFEPVKETLRRHGIQTDYPWSNIVIPLNKKWLIKASGFANRKHTIKAYLGMGYDDVLTPEGLDRFNTEYGKTFQTISRMGYWLRMQEITELMQFKHIGIQQKYLAHIPGRPHIMNDTNYVIITEKIANPQNIMETTLLEDPAVISELTYLIGYTGFWNINDNNLIVANNKIYVIETEQPNVHRPQDFFLKDPSILRSNAGHGWSELKNNIIRPYALKYNKNLSHLEACMDSITAEINKVWAAQ